MNTSLIRYDSALAMHLCTSTPLFRRAVLQSGTVATGPPISVSQKENEYLALLKFCEIDEQAPDRLAQLKAVPSERIVEGVGALGIAIFAALADETFFDRGLPTRWNEGELIGSCGWIESIVIGDSFTEVSLILLHAF